MHLRGKNKSEKKLQLKTFTKKRCYKLEKLQQVKITREIRVQAALIIGINSEQ